MDIKEKIDNVLGEAKTVNLKGKIKVGDILLSNDNEGVYFTVTKLNDKDFSYKSNKTGISGEFNYRLDNNIVKDKVFRPINV